MVPAGKLAIRLVQDFKNGRFAMRRRWNRFSRLVCASLLAAVVGSLSTTHPAHADQALVIRDFVLSRGINEREPVDITYSFLSSDKRAYAFLRINNLGAPTNVSVVWHYEDRIHAAIELEIGTSPGWRTWSSANLRPGWWRVELLDHEGLVLAEHSFLAVPSFSEFAEVPADTIGESASPMQPGPMPSVQSAPISSQAASGDLDG